MNEKRFTGKLLTNSNGEEFGFTIYDEDKRMSIDEVVGVLNEQQATNSALRTENNHLIDVIKEYAKKYEEQQATIEQLQDLCGESDSENAKLRIENEQLKNKLNKGL